MHVPPRMTLDTIRFDQTRTLPALFEERCRRCPEAEAYRHWDPAGGGWKSLRWDEMRDRVAHWRGALAGEGFAAGDRVAVMLPNGVDWVCLDQAAQSLGLVVVPLYPTDNPESACYILTDCGARLLVTEVAHWDRLQPFAGALTQLARVICIGGDAGSAAGVVRGLENWLAGARPTPPPAPADPNALATIVYTSGTTGRPKGVMLSHRNILANIEAVLQGIAGYREDLFLSFLPLSHALERTVGYYLPIATGGTVAFARSIQTLPEDLVAVQPSMLVSVPRLYERVYARLQHQLESGGLPARTLFEWAESVGWRRFEAAQHRGAEPGALAGMMWPVLRHLVADKLLARLGGRLRIAVSGGAPVSPQLMHCFIGLGLPLLQGYGLTEAGPVVSANTLQDNVPESVGKPLAGVEVKLGARDEVLVRGPNVMLGYWNAPDQTRAAIDPEGWLHTGDIGRLDDESRLYITGRLKEILVTSTGEKVAPAAMELAITEDPLFGQAMVVGEGRPFVAALAVLAAPGWQDLAGRLGIDPLAPHALERPEVHEAVLQRLQARLRPFPSPARVRRMWLTLQPWTVDEGLLTPTMKLRRRPLEQRFAPQIRSLYEQPGSGGGIGCEVAPASMRSD